MKRREFLLGSFAAAVTPKILGAGKKNPEQKNSPSEVEAFALPEDGLFSVRPHLQLLGERSAAVVWMTKVPATGFTEWSQDNGATWTKSWTEEDGLLDAGATVHRTVLTGFDPSKPVRFRVCSQENPHVFPYRAEFKGEVMKLESELAPILPKDGKVSFAMFNDMHNSLPLYPKLLATLDRPVNFTVFNGDISNYVDNEDQIRRYILAPLAYVSDKTHTAMWYLRGNHETRGGFSRKFRNYLALPNGHYYGAVTLGAARIVFIDTGEDKSDDHKEYAGIVDFDHYIDRQIEWLKAEFATPAWRTAKFRIAVMHIPPAGVRKLDGNTFGNGPKRLGRLRKALNEANLSVVLGAHLHRSANDDPKPDRPYPVIVGGGPKIMPEEKKHWFADATLTRCDYDEHELVITQTNVKGVKLFERRIAPNG